MEYLEKEEHGVSIQELEKIRENIEEMSKFNQVEVLRLLKNYNGVTLNENKYGVHINLTELHGDVLLMLQNYIQYVNTQEINLNQIEKQKEEFKNNYFTKESKDITGKKGGDNNTKIHHDATIEKNNIRN